VTAAWVAGSVRATAMARRCIGSGHARELAQAGSLAQALRALEATPYGREVHRGQTLAQAQHGVAAVTLWHLRVLAGWVPHGGVHMLRTLAGWFEIANTDALLLGLWGGRPGPYFGLGALATAWPRLAAATSPAAVRAALAASAWGDPGGESPLALRAGMRCRWAARLATLTEPAPTWAAGGALLFVASERFVAGRELPPGLRQPLRHLVGDAALAAGTLGELSAVVPARARWVLDGVASPGELWRAEAAWWSRVGRDATGLLRTGSTGAGPVLGAAAALAADAWRTRAALESAARGGGPGGPLEAYDAVA
jgi:hypothetical protein